jgi:hypothetical protein
MRMISLVVMVMLGRVHNDGRPAVGLVPIGMLKIRFGVMIGPSSPRARSDGERRAETEYPE